jgi:hypothetical protein
MIKEDPFKIKFGKLQPWIYPIFQAIKKELRNDHLVKSPAFVQKHFPKRAIDKLTLEEFANAYMREVMEGDESLGEKIAARWVLKHAELYHFFLTQLSKINPKYDDIEHLPEEAGNFLFDTALSQFGATATYIFCILNAVVFTEEQLSRLKELALAEKEDKKIQEEKRSFDSVEAVKAHYEKEMLKMLEKYEKRMQGIERKYIQDVDGLKKQIAQLHKKLEGKTVGMG